MKNTTEMFAGCLYLFEGESSSSSCFIQDEVDAKLFISLANTQLRDFLRIIEYNLSKDSWLMIVKLRSKVKILKSYKIKRDKSVTCDRKNDHTEIWKIISEQMRQFLRLYVLSANRRSGREGSLVKAPYKRSYFESKENAQMHVEKLRNQLLKREQRMKKYRGRKKFFKISKRKFDGHIFLCSHWKNSRKNIQKFYKNFREKCTDFIGFENFMESDIIYTTLSRHRLQC